jgi:hypothetical protein
MRSTRKYHVHENTGLKILTVLHILRTSEYENVVSGMPPSCISLYLHIYSAWIFGRILFVLGVYGFFVIGQRPVNKIIHVPKRMVFTEDFLLK